MPKTAPLAPTPTPVELSVKLDAGRRQPEYDVDSHRRPRRLPRRPRRLPQPQPRDASEQPGQQIDQGEPRVSVRPLDDLPEDKQRQAVGQDVHDPGVEEHRREQAPVLAVDYERGRQCAEVDEDLRTPRPAADLQRDPQQEVQDQQGMGHHRPVHARSADAGSRPCFVVVSHRLPFLWYPCPRCSQYEFGCTDYQCVYRTINM